MPSDPTAIEQAQERVAAFEQAMSSNIGVAEVVTDGVKVRYDRAQMMAELSYWRRRLASLQKRRPFFIGVNMGGAFK
ncbi:MAG: hypothetical protein AAGG38_06315 [Planctomycetota bacterium]